MLKLITCFFGWVFGGSDQSEVEGPRFEELGGRLLMSATSIKVGVDEWGTLEVQGTEHNDKVVIEMRGTSQGDVTQVTIGKMTSVFVDVQRINVDLGAGKDKLTMSIIAPNRIIPIDIDMDAGKDFVNFSAIGLANHDELWYDLTQTSIYLGAGDDIARIDSDAGIRVFGEDGEDLITTVRKNVFSEVRHSFSGGRGNDKIVTHVGGFIYGDEGNDTLISKSVSQSFSTVIECGIGNDFVRTGIGVNYISTGSGNKVIRGGAGRDIVYVVPSAIWDGFVYEVQPLGKLDFKGGGDTDFLFLHSEFELQSLKIKSVETVGFQTVFKG